MGHPLTLETAARLRVLNGGRLIRDSHLQSLLPVGSCVSGSGRFRLGGGEFGALPFPSSFGCLGDDTASAYLRDDRHVMSVIVKGRPADSLTFAESINASGMCSVRQVVLPRP